MRMFVALFGAVMAVAALALAGFGWWQGALREVMPPVLMFALIAATCASYLRNARRPK